MKARPREAGSTLASASKFLSAIAMLMIPALALSGPAKPAGTPSEQLTKSASKNVARPQVHVEKRTSRYWRVTFDNPPFNIFGPDTIPQLEDVVAQIETDPNLRVVVFDSAVPGYFLTHYDFDPPLSASTDLPSGSTGLHPLPDMLVRISRAPVVSIALIRGRATGVGSELALASDMRFASKEKAILSQWEVGAGLVPGGGPMARLPRLIGRGRALEVLLGSDDINGDLAAQYGYVNRAFPDTQLDGFVDGLALRISGFDRQAIADTKRLVDFASLPSDPEIGAGWDAFITSVQRPVAQKNITRLMEMGLQKNPDVEARLGHYTEALGER
ncbi:enoyl-CoA hydratase/isomerase family protein [Rhizobium leguminosarum]|uniref:enoyl-CoA hydratase/isomerase family protein n=1 Tax=Rhizobium leguminosarum TaxID=384 RepID=UPI0010317380|nr:enoyl-CoA hydratase/isomerase family protein [Rhizobium leguminosarum]QIO76229.1 enoyl-CoA hydratase/isomerase family protein [Rhizobium leguminosarum bv. trifolii]QIO83247.1 enoyl-CoA hydratase/isomerase family protein [Rhizobium leguminosarum bv. trifolii]TAU16500.1 enoyl-CoA hydratase/isomerase family protein [Rhizobium leguminosarum]TAU34805.1 enoyl-CoA hydratase/isomerase family protein [Rhizobium leguminosarum]TAX44017.1 enoyl-CoA hydratase/isomerase family protein [Rhizobium legumino